VGADGEDGFAGEFYYLEAGALEEFLEIGGGEGGELELFAVVGGEPVGFAGFYEGFQGVDVGFVEVVVEGGELVVGGGDDDAAGGADSAHFLDGAIGVGANR